MVSGVLRGGGRGTHVSQVGLHLSEHRVFASTVFASTVIVPGTAATLDARVQQREGVRVQAAAPVEGRIARWALTKHVRVGNLKT